MSETKFKEGDFITLITPGSNFYTKGKPYKVFTGFEGHLCVRDDDGLTDMLHLCVTKFKKAKLQKV